jgi:hypothetical protein
MSHPQPTEVPFDFVCHDDDAGVVYRPWTDGWAVGYKASFTDGHSTYIYLNASGASDDATANVFVCQGRNGDIGADNPLHFYDLDAGDAADPMSVTNHNTDDTPAVCLLPDGTIHTFGHVRFLTGAAARAYLDDHLSPPAEP